MGLSARVEACCSALACSSPRSRDPRATAVSVLTRDRSRGRERRSRRRRRQRSASRRGSTALTRTRRGAAARHEQATTPWTRTIALSPGFASRQRHIPRVEVRQEHAEIGREAAGRRYAELASRSTTCAGQGEHRSPHRSPRLRDGATTRTTWRSRLHRKPYRRRTWAVEREAGSTSPRHEPLVPGLSAERTARTRISSAPDRDLVLTDLDRARAGTTQPQPPYGRPSGGRGARRSGRVKRTSSPQDTKRECAKGRHREAFEDRSPTADASPMTFER